VYHLLSTAFIEFIVSITFFIFKHHASYSVGDDPFAGDELKIIVIIVIVSCKASSRVKPCLTHPSKKE